MYPTLWTNLFVAMQLCMTTSQNMSRFIPGFDMSTILMELVAMYDMENRSTADNIISVWFQVSVRMNRDREEGRAVEYPSITVKEDSTLRLLPGAVRIAAQSGLTISSFMP